MSISTQLYHNAVQLLWRRVGRKLDDTPLTGVLILSLSASIPSLVVTSLIGMEMLFWRLVLATAYALILGWFISRVMLRQDLSQPPVSPDVITPSSAATSVRTFARVSWRSLTAQFNEALFPILIGFVLASALTIYIPAYWVRPLLNETVWFGPYLAAALAIPFQLSGGAEVPVAAALLVKGASLGTALSVMMAAPSTTISVVLWLRRSAGTARAALYMLVAWLVAGSLGVIVNLAQRLLAGGL
jgi:hypothetical protein